MTKNTLAKAQQNRNRVLTEAQRAVNRAAALVLNGIVKTDPNAVNLELNVAYGLIQTVKGMA